MKFLARFKYKINQAVNNRDNADADRGVSTAVPGAHSGFVAVTPKYQRKNWHKSGLICLSGVLAILVFVVVTLIIKLVNPGEEKREICETKECLKTAATLSMNLDLTADPCDDFYQYACGKWAEEHPRPEAAPMNDWFSERQIRVSQNLRDFLKMNNSEVENEPLPVKQTRLLYEACIDTDAMDGVAYAPVEKLMQKIGFPEVPSFFKPNRGQRSNGNNKNDDGGVHKLLARIKRFYGKDILIGWDVYPDPRNRSLYRMAVGTPEASGGLPLIEQYAKRVNQFHASLSSKEDEKLSEQDKAMIETYNHYVRSVISEYLFATSRFNASQEQLKSASEKIYQITKFTIRMNQQVENMNKSLDPLQDIFDISIPTIQNFTNLFASNASEGNVTELPFWTDYLKELFHDSPELSLDVDKELLLTSRQDMHYMKHIFGYVLAKQPKETVELYIWFTLLEDMILYTTDTMRHLNREYISQVTGVKSLPSRSIYCTTVVNRMMGMAMSYGIAEPSFIEKTKPKVQTMLVFIQSAFYQLVRELAWMDDVTKRETLDKAARMVSMIGFPEWILNKTALEEHYNGIEINETDYLSTMLRLVDRSMRKNMAKLREEPKREWATTPSTVNAFHTFQSNAITVPLAILQFPFYNLGLESLNYGAIGSILGHELTHGFDDSGRHYDKHGNMRQWWTNATINEYVNRTKCFVEQYSSFKVPEIGANIDGEQTLGENIADNGGIREAFMAYQMYKTVYGNEPYLPGFENYTSEQMFFLSFGNLWCETTTEASLRLSINDSHCPGRIRLTAVLSNFNEFSRAFNCPAQSKMISENICRIW